jgi:hypothetical protein
MEQTTEKFLPLQHQALFRFNPTASHLSITAARGQWQLDLLDSLYSAVLI